jgi:hypothetical protein
MQGEAEGFGVVLEKFPNGDGSDGFDAWGHGLNESNGGGDGTRNPMEPCDLGVPVGARSPPI